MPADLVKDLAKSAFGLVAGEIRRLNGIEAAFDVPDMAEAVISKASKDLEQVIGTRKGTLDENMVRFIRILTESGILKQMAEIGCVFYVPSGKENDKILDPYPNLVERLCQNVLG